MSKKVVIIISVSIVGVVCVGALLAAAGWYPVAMVDGAVVFYSQYHAAYNLSHAYYSYLVQNNKTADDEAVMEKQLKLAAFEGLVDSKLVRKKLLSYMDSGELQKEIDAKIAPLWSDAQSRDALRAMTQATEGVIKKFFLEQEAQNELLSNKLQAEGKNFADWLLQARTDARVSLFFSPSMQWTEKGVELR